MNICEMNESESEGCVGRDLVLLHFIFVLYRFPSAVLWGTSVMGFQVSSAALPDMRGREGVLSV